MSIVFEKYISVYISKLFIFCFLATSRKSVLTAQETNKTTELPQQAAGLDVFHFGYLRLLLLQCRISFILWSNLKKSNSNGLVQDCSISSALATEILQSCTKLSICP